MTFRLAATLAHDPALMAPPKLLVAPCVVAGHSHLVTLGPKQGKSTTVSGLVARASRDGIRCGILTVDESTATTLQRLIRCEADLSVVYLSDRWDPDSDLAAEVAALELAFLAVDHLGKLVEQHPDFGVGTQGDSVLYGRLVAPFTTLARDHNVAVWLLDQARKTDGKYAGPVAKAGSVDVLIELEAKDGGLVATPRGRVPLPPFRIDLDDDGIPTFTAEGDGAGDRTAPVAIASHRKLLVVLADAEPEGLTSSAWLRLSELPETSYNRGRRALLREGLVLGPDATRTKRYRVTEKGETRLGDLPRTCHDTSMVLPPPTTHLKGGGGGRTDGTAEAPGTATDLPRQCHGSMAPARL
ncbi:MAG: hypothetical protein ACKVZ0_00105 [Gemmatimonadales bacterium]